MFGLLCDKNADGEITKSELSEICKNIGISEVDEQVFMDQFDSHASSGMGVKHPKTNEWMIHTARIQDFLDQCTNTGAIQMVIESQPQKMLDFLKDETQEEPS